MAPRYNAWIRDQQVYFTFLPSDAHQAYLADSMDAWNVLVSGNRSLLGLQMLNGVPIRDHLPTPNNGEYEMGVLSSEQMEARGYDSWEDLGVDAVAYNWSQDMDGLESVRIESDVLINASVADDPVQHRKLLTQAFGHALGLSQDTFHFALMYPGVFRQPPNYRSVRYPRMRDLLRVHFLLETINETLNTDVWVLAQGADMAVWSQTHDNTGQHGALLMTDVTPTEVEPGGELVLNHIQVENLGNQPASSIDLRVYLSMDDEITDQDVELGLFQWETFNAHSAWTDGSLTVSIPDQIPAGVYHVGMILSTPTVERSTENNTAILLGDFTSGFVARQVTVAASVSNPGDACGLGRVFDCVGSCVDEATVNDWLGDGSCDDGEFLDPNEVPVNLACNDFRQDEGDCR